MKEGIANLISEWAESYLLVAARKTQVRIGGLGMGFNWSELTALCRHRRQARAPLSHRQAPPSLSVCLGSGSAFDLVQGFGSGFVCCGRYLRFRTFLVLSSSSRINSR